MVPPDGDRSRRLPTLSWESVVDADADASTAASTDASTAASTLTSTDASAGRHTVADGARTPTRTAASPVPPPPPTAPLVPPSILSVTSDHGVTVADALDAVTPIEPIEFAPLIVDSGALAAAQPDLGGPTIEPIQIPVDLTAASGGPVGVDAVEDLPELHVELDLHTGSVDVTAVIAPHAPDRVRTAAPPPIIPAIGDVSIGPAVFTADDEIDADGTDAASADLPAIQEATPVAEAGPDLAELTVAQHVLSPRLPAAAQPDQRRPAALVTLEPSPVGASTAGPARTRRRSRRGIKLVLMLIVTAGLVAAGVVFGRPYLFPGDWDESTAPYAAAVESVRGTDFAEPLAVVAEPTAAYGARLADELQRSGVDDASRWRALGLLSGPVDDTQVAESLAGWRSAFYSTDDGQVYRDVAATGPAADAQVVQAMVAAALDQEFRWSAEHTERTLDDAALTTAEVIRRARAVQLESEYAEPDAAVDATSLGGLPTIVRYQALAPYLYAEFDLTTDGDDDDVLHLLGATGPGPLPVDPPKASTSPQMVGTDVVSAPGVAMDRSFWLLVFGGFVDPTSAYTASEAVVENTVTMADRGPTRCVYATFSGGGVDQTALLRTTLESWSAAAPPEFASSFSVLDDGSLQLVSCDPGEGFEAPVRADADRALAAWRVAELATIEAIEQGGSGDLEADFDFAWPFVAASPLVTDLMSMPADASPEEIAAASRAAVAAIFTPAG